MSVSDARLSPPKVTVEPKGMELRIRLLAAAGLPLSFWYFAWLLQPQRVGHPVLYGLLVAAELFNFVQAAGFLWTCLNTRSRDPVGPPVGSVDVFLPVYNEPVDVVEPALAAAMLLRGDVRVALLDDGHQPSMRNLAERFGARYIERPTNEGAKAGNINHALGLTSAQFVTIFDCDHVPVPAFLERTLGHFTEDTALVQTPQSYANVDNPVAEAAGAQQALFFGPIARGKDGMGAMFCCGTNVVLRRTALEGAGGFPQHSVTEDFELSIGLHENGWKSAYVPEVLAQGLGPEDMGSYVSQQFRWARGCVSSIPRLFKARLPWRLKAQYLLSSMYFVTGWTLLIYILFPILRLTTGAQPLAMTTSNAFLVHFAPYFGIAMLVVALVARGEYTFEAFCLAAASFWIHIWATVATITRRARSFNVTPKKGESRRQPGAVWPALLTVTALAWSAGFGLSRGVSPAILNNAAFASVHMTVLLRGVWPALRGIK